ncbi:MAG TPA: 30S ribosomal protein S17 [Candidatus Nanoarchaeia archaeon]|nr:30S ribosomal protein S17 [Candidatus Nanoarchaeia archaeon]
MAKAVKTEKAVGKDVACSDKRCPKHGSLRTRGQVFSGVIRSDRMQNAVNVEWSFLKYLPKFERYMKKRTRVKAHLPSCIEAKQGDTVRIAECRPLSGTIRFVVFERVSGGK